MQIEEAQWEMRWSFLGGFGGQLVSGLLWLISAALASRIGPRPAILVLVLGGVGIFPLTQLAVRAMGRPGRVSPANALYGLGAQVAFVLPLSLPLVGAATLHRLDWFYPAFMVAVGAHYLPFVFLYGMRLYAVLCGILVTGGILLGTVLPAPFPAGGWLTGLLLLAFALAGRAAVRREEATRAVPPVATRRAGSPSGATAGPS